MVCALLLSTSLFLLLLLMVALFLSLLLFFFFNYYISCLFAFAKNQSRFAFNWKRLRWMTICVLSKLNRITETVILWYVIITLNIKTDDFVFFKCERDMRMIRLTWFFVVVLCFVYAFSMNMMIIVWNGQWPEELTERFLVETEKTNNDDQPASYNTSTRQYGSATLYIKWIWNKFTTIDT